MKRIVILALCALMLVCVVPNASADEAGWSASVSPGFAFNGDTVELTVTGVPEQYAFVKVMLGNVTVHDMFLMLDDMGKAKQNWTIPILADTGTYRFLVVSNGLNMTSTSLNVIFDDVTYLTWLVNGLQEDNARLKAMVLANSEETQDVHDRLFWVWAASTITLAGAVVGMFLTYMYYTDELKRKMEVWRYREGLRGRLSTFYRTFIDPAPDGWQYRAVPTLDIEAKRQREKIKGKVFQPKIILPTEDGLGFTEHPVQVMGMEEGKKAVPDAVPAEPVKKERGTPRLVLWKRRVSERRRRRKAKRAARELEDMKRRMRELEKAGVVTIESKPVEKDEKVTIPDAPPTESMVTSFESAYDVGVRPLVAVETTEPVRDTGTSPAPVKKRTVAKKRSGGKVVE